MVVLMFVKFTTSWSADTSYSTLYLPIFSASPKYLCATFPVHMECITI